MKEQYLILTKYLNPTFRHSMVPTSKYQNDSTFIQVSYKNATKLYNIENDVIRSGPRNCITSKTMLYKNATNCITS